MPPEFTRPGQQFRYSFKGMKLNQLPDALPDGKYAMALNIRALRDSDLQSRPGQLLQFQTDNGGSPLPITDLVTYAALGTDDLPRILSRDTSDRIWLGATQVGSLTNSATTLGASMLPFRPGASPNPYVYIANGLDYQKFSAPSSLDVVIQANAGIAEPPSAPDAALLPVLNTTTPTTETIYPTTYQNPPFPGPTTHPWTDPANAIDGNPGTFAEGVGGPNLSDAQQCLWQDWTAPTIPYTQLTLHILLEVPSCNSDPVNGGAFVDYSLDVGVEPYTSAFETHVPVGLQEVVVSLPPNQDLTKIGVFSSSNAPGTDIKIYEIFTVGVSGGGFFDRTGVASDWTQGGTAGAPSDTTGPGDNAVAVIADPLNANVFSIGYQFIASPPSAWQVGQTMIQNTNPYLLLDSMQPALTAQISAIYYFSGSSGRCIIVPQNLPVATVPNFQGNNPQAKSFLDPSAIAALRRGAILWLNSTEYVYVLSVTIGPDNTICIETSTAGTLAPGDSIVAMPTMIVYGVTTPTTGGNDLTAPLITGAVTTGTGTYTRTVDFFASISSTTGLQPQDYLHASMLIDAPTSLTEMLIEFDVGDGTFTQDFYYYVVRPSDLSNFLAGSVTQLASSQIIAQRAAIDAQDPSIANNRGSTLSGGQLGPGSNQRTEILFPISALTRVGTGSQTLVDTTSVRITIICTGNVQITFGSLSTWGGSQPDVGQAGSPYFYRVRPRSKVTGVVGNPSPSTRYGMSPLRFSVTLSLPSATYDPQIDTWDVFRYGGSVTSWRYIGSANVGADFIDNFSDDAALAGDELTFDEFQPWPSIDIPNNGNASQVVGTVAVVSSARSEILDYLPGTLVQLGGQNVYTLQTRPTLLSGTNYLLQFIENAGALSNVTFNIQEPIIAQRRLPYMWGPDASGTVFAVGDSLRPGTLSFAKNYAPDSVPDSYNIEICAPSEPLLGGEVMDGLGFVASPERWWALYPTPDNPAQRFSFVQQPFLRGLVAPFGHCNDGVSLYWWAKDGIYSSTKGSLTDEDLYNLFPHEGVLGNDVTYAGVTVHAPDYSKCGTFRLAFANGYLYATYQDSTGTYHTLVLDTIDGAWSLDDYADPVSCFFHPTQEAGTLTTAPAARYDEVLMGDVNGAISSQTQGQNDLGGAISCLVASREYDAEDSRAPKQWGDFFIDLTPAANAGVTLTPYSLGAAVAAGTTVTSSASRQRTPASVGGIVVSAFLGLVASWIDDFSTSQTDPTILHIWQPSFTIQPATDISWKTFGSSFGIDGYMHVREIAVAWVSTAAITLTITPYDGQAPATPITIPSSAGAYQKVLFQVPANKGQLFNFQATSSAPFQFFFDDFEVRVGQWGRSSPYQTFKGFGGRVRDDAPI